jgi:hypothetical protein
VKPHCLALTKRPSTWKADENGLRIVSDINLSHPNKASFAHGSLALSLNFIHGLILLPILVNVTQRGNWDALLKETISKHGHISLKINNAGGASDRTLPVPTVTDDGPLSKLRHLPIQACSRNDRNRLPQVHRPQPCRSSTLCTRSCRNCKRPRNRA